MAAKVAQTIGSGDNKVLALHGWFGPGVFDGYFTEEAGFDLDKYQFAVVHNPGYGDARDEALPEDMTGLAKQLLALTDVLGWDEFHIIGHSYGGAAALRIASLAPDRVLSLVGIAPVMPTGFDDIAVENTGADENTGPTYLASYAKGPDAEDGPQMIIGGLDPVLAEMSNGVKNLARNLYEVLDEEGFKQYFAVWTGCDFASDVKGLDIPTLFLLGEADPFAKPNYVEGTVEDMKDGAAEVREIKGGHFLPLSGREESQKILSDFLG